jgi:hypothetical protein
LPDEVVKAIVGSECFATTIIFGVGLAIEFIVFVNINPSGSIFCFDDISISIGQLNAGTERVGGAGNVIRIVVYGSGSFAIGVGATDYPSESIVDFLTDDFTECVGDFVLPIYCVIAIRSGRVIIGIGNSRNVTSSIDLNSKRSC